MKELKISPGKYTIRTNSTSRYLTEVSGIPLLGLEEEYRIGIRAAAGDEEAVDLLVKSNLRFAISAAKQYASHSEELLNDLISQANIGLLHAARTFDPTRGFKFISYAVWHIRKEILKYLNDHSSTIRLPLNVRQELTKVAKISSKLESRLEREPNDFEILEEAALADINISQAALIRNRILTQPSVAFENFGQSTDQSWSPSDWLEAEDSTIQWIDQESRASLISEVKKQLSPDEFEIVTRRLGIGRINEESFTLIAESFGKTPEAIRLIYRKAIRKLKGRSRRIRLIEPTLA